MAVETYNSADRVEPAKHWDHVAVQAEQQPGGGGWKDKIERFLGNHPEATMAFAVGVGIAVGWWAKRK